MKNDNQQRDLDQKNRDEENKASHNSDKDWSSSSDRDNFDTEERK